MSCIVVDKTAYDEAVEWINKNYAEIPKDDLLRLYAYYKIAKRIRHESNNKQPIVSAFKANAIMQVSHLEIEKGKDYYSALVEKLKQMD